MTYYSMRLIARLNFSVTSNCIPSVIKLFQKKKGKNFRNLRFHPLYSNFAANPQNFKRILNWLVLNTGVIFMDYGQGCNYNSGYVYCSNRTHVNQ